MVSIREIVATTNGYDGADKVATLPSCQAGDILVIFHSGNSNPFMADPTSTAGTVTQRATVTNAFAGRCRLRAYTCPVGTTGSKTVTFPYNDGAGGAGGDMQGHVYVIAGPVATDGTNTNAGVDSASSSHVMNAVSPAGAAALLLGSVSAFVTAAGANYWDPTGSGMTEGAESYDSGFLGLWTGYQQLSASGSTGTRTITPVTSDNRYVSITIAVSAAGITQAIGTASETDTAGTFGRRKTRAVGIAAETDSAIALGRKKTRTIGIAAEGDAAISLGRRKARALGVAGETDSALSVGRSKRLTLGVAIELDQAMPMGGVPTHTELPGVLVAAGTAAILTATGAAATLTASGMPAALLTANGTP